VLLVPSSILVNISFSSSSLGISSHVRSAIFNIIVLSVIFYLNIIYMANTRRQKYSVKGWSKQQPGTHQRTVMMKKCGKKCFLGPKKTFPICTKNTCKVNKKGVMAAYMRAREYMTIKGTKKYTNIANKAKSILKK
jgi:hypothetical protein